MITWQVTGHFGVKSTPVLNYDFKFYFFENLMCVRNILYEFIVGSLNCNKKIAAPAKCTMHTQTALTLSASLPTFSN
jgi:hypothetical protein